MAKILLATATTAILAIGVSISSNDPATRQLRDPSAPAAADRGGCDADADRAGDGVRGTFDWARD